MKATKFSAVHPGSQIRGYLTEMTRLGNLLHLNPATQSRIVSYARVKQGGNALLNMPEQLMMRKQRLN